MPISRRGEIFLDAFAVRAQERKGELRPAMACLCCLSIPGGRFLGARAGAICGLEELPELVRRPRMALARGTLEP